MDPDQPSRQPYEVILSPLAVQDLTEIVTFIAADNPLFAERFGRALIQKTRLLVTFPELGRMVPEFGEPLSMRVNSSTRRIASSTAWTTPVAASKWLAFGTPHVAHRSCSPMHRQPN